MLSTKVKEVKFNMINNFQKEKSVKYFLIEEDDKYRIGVSVEDETSEKEFKSKRLFEDKELVLNIIQLLYENAISFEHFNDIIEDII